MKDGTVYTPDKDYSIIQGSIIFEVEGETVALPFDNVLSIDK